ncbi:hypothetical protein ALQ02_200100 [Pseudomonas savastanoi pv. phaseolicola]|nr:hypothetical protein ALQ02_200100 [Pseudomonas savastanoi pv. phaseolicola]
MSYAYLRDQRATDSESLGLFSEKPKRSLLEEEPKKEWYLVQCKSGQDSRAEENLTAQGYANFRPTINASSESRSVNTKHNSPLFPGYLFIHLSASDNWAPVRSTKGILTIVKFGGRAHAVRNEIIQDIKTRAESLNYSHSSHSEKDSAPLDNRGSEISDILSAKSHEERTLLLVGFLQRESLNKT